MGHQSWRVESGRGYGTLRYLGIPLYPRKRLGLYTPSSTHHSQVRVAEKHSEGESDVRRVCDYATQSTLPRGYVLLMHLHRITDDPYSDTAAAHGT